MRKPKKRLASVIMGVALLATSGFAVTAFTACGDGDEQTPPAHTHTFDMNKWAFDDNHHYHPATCEHKNEELDPAPHTGDKSCSVCEWVASSQTVAVTGVSLDVTEKTLDVNGTFTLTPTVAPADATNKAVTWSVTGDTVTVVNGLVTAVKPGTATVTVTTKDGNKTASCVVTVNTPQQSVAVTGVSLDVTEKTLVVGGTFTLVHTVAPADATNKAVAWSVTGDAVTVVNGLVTAVKPGTATVTVTTDDGSFTATCAVTINLEKAGWQGGFNETEGVFVSKSNGKSELHNYELNGSEKAYAAADYNTMLLTYKPGAASDTSDAGEADIKLIVRDKYDEELAFSFRNYYNYCELLYDGSKIDSFNYRPGGHEHSNWGSDEQYAISVALAENNVQITVNGTTYLFADTQDLDFTSDLYYSLTTDKHIPEISGIAVTKTELKTFDANGVTAANAMKTIERDNETDVSIYNGKYNTTDWNVAENTTVVTPEGGKVGKTGDDVNNTVEFSFRPNALPQGYYDQNSVALLFDLAGEKRLGVRYLYHYKLNWIQAGTTTTAGKDWETVAALSAVKFLPDYNEATDNGWSGYDNWFNVKIEFTNDVVRSYVNGVKYAEAAWHGYTFDENTALHIDTYKNGASIKNIRISHAQVEAPERTDWTGGFKATGESGDVVYTATGQATQTYAKSVTGCNTVNFKFRAGALSKWGEDGHLTFRYPVSANEYLCFRISYANWGNAKASVKGCSTANWDGEPVIPAATFDRNADDEHWYDVTIVFDSEVVRFIIDGTTLMNVPTPQGFAYDANSGTNFSFTSWNATTSFKNAEFTYTDIPAELLTSYIDTVKAADPSLYTDASYKALTDAIAAAEKAIADKDHTADGLRAQRAAVKSAYDALITVAWQNAYNALDAAIKAEDAAYNETEYAEKYTEASLKTYTDALAAAKATLEKADATEAELTGAKTALDDAKDGLIDKTGDIVAVTGVTLNKTELALNIGQTETLVATVAPENATDKVVSWSIEGDAATVEDGVVTAVKPGTATVTVTTRDGEMTATCTVTVTYSAPLWLGDGFDKTGDAYIAKSAAASSLHYYDVDGTEKKIDISQTNTLSFTYIPGEAPATNQENSYIDICLTDEASHTLVFHIQNYWIYNAIYYNGQLVSYFNYANRLHNHGAWGAADAENNISFSFETTSIIININGDNYILHDIYGFDLTKPIKVHFATGSHTPVIKNPTFSSTTPVQSDWTGNGFNEYVENGQTVYTSTSTPTTGARTFTHKNNTLGTNNTVEFGFRPNDWNAWDDWGYIMFAIDTDGHTSLLIRVLYKNGGNPSRIDVYKRVDGTWTSENPLVEGAFDKKATAAIWFESIKFIFTNEKLIAYVDGTKVIDTAMIEGVTITENSTWSIETKINAASIKNVTVSRTDLTETAEQTSAQPQSETAYIKEND